MPDLIEQQLGNKIHWNLPPVFTSLVGRELDVKAASALLLHSDMRMLTLTGTGGIGKTRLALQIATEVGSAFSDGVCFVSLAPISDPALVLSAIAQALELRETPDCSLQDLMHDYLCRRHLLLLLDNFEQVSEATPVLSELLAQCSTMRLLVTSRVPLHSVDEHLFSVNPLASPDLTSLPDNKTLASIASLDLFIQRARMVQSSFELTQTNIATIAAICSRLDGLPLAIELAAARINLLPPQALLKRLGNSLNVLTSNTDGRLARHLTMRNTIQWSYDLLSADEQRLFRRLSIFSGGFTLQAIESLYERLDGSSEDVLNALSSLIEKNLLRSPEQDNEDPHLEMLETLRAFALEILQASGEFETVKHAHMQYFLSLAEESSAAIPGPHEATWKQRLEGNIANLRAIMHWSLADSAQTQSREIALRLGIALKSFWHSSGYFREGKTFLEQALIGSGDPLDTLHANAMLTVAHFALLFCEYDQAQHLLEACHTYYQMQNDTAQLAFIAGRQGWLAALQSRSAQARAHYEEALTLSKALHDEKMVNTVRYHLAFLALNEGSYQQSQTLLEESLLYHKKNGLTRDIAATLGDLAQLRRLSSVIPPVEEMYHLLNEAMLYAQEAGDQNILVALRYGMAWVAFLRGNLDEAYQLVNETLAFYREAGKVQSLGHYLELRGRIYAAQGKDAEARIAFEESIVQTAKQNDLDTLSSDLIELAHLAIEQREYARAIRLLGVDEKMREIGSHPIHPFESLHRNHIMAIARAVLGQELFARLWNEGRALSPLDALTISDNLPPKSQPSTIKNLSYPSGLTRREIEVLHLVAQGFTDSQVAEQLIISTRTVTTHLTSIYNKLQINSRAAATNFAVKNHLA